MFPASGDGSREYPLQGQAAKFTAQVVAPIIASPFPRAVRRCSQVVGKRQEALFGVIDDLCSWEKVNLMVD